MSDIVKIDKAALLDLIQATIDLVGMVKGSNNPKTIESLGKEIDKLKYISKLILTSMQSYENNNQ